MTAHRLANVALALLIAAVLSTAWMLPGPDQLQTEADTAADLIAAQDQARAAASCGGDITNCQPSYKRLAPREAHKVAAK